ANMALGPSRCRSPGAFRLNFKPRLLLRSNGMISQIFKQDYEMALQPEVAFLAEPARSIPAQRANLRFFAHALTDKGRTRQKIRDNADVFRVVVSNRLFLEIYFEGFPRCHVEIADYFLVLGEEWIIAVGKADKRLIP